MIKLAKNYGLTTSVVTNGTKITEDFLIEMQPYLDWIALSVDSLNDDVNLQSGRAIIGKKVLSLQSYEDLVNII